VQRAVRTYWQDRDIAPAEGVGQTLYARLDQDAVHLSLDSSGDNLYRRGLKTHGAAAPLRETLAAAVLLLSGYDPERPLFDPMCGSGTFALEAALMAKRIPPGYARGFAFMQWPSFRPARWHHLKATAAEKVKRFDRPLIHASDIDPEMIRPLADCIQRNGLEDVVTVRRADFFALSAPPDSSGLIVLNPPYGRRLTPDAHLQEFYRSIHNKLSNDFNGWRIAWIVPRPEWVRRMARGLKPFNLVHGGLELTLLVGRL
jgi:putative N6-adenine-specific DNA methylase